MSETIENFSEREEIEMLLPWYQSGQLEAADHDRVERYLTAHPEMRAQLELVEDERGETIRANEMLGAPATGALDRLRAQISAETPEPSRLAMAGQNLWQELQSLFSAPTPRAVQWASAAAALVLVAQAGVIGSLMSPATDPGTGYQTASGPQAGVAGTRVLVRFAPTATAAEITTALTAVKGEIVGGPKPGAMFEVRISKQKLSDADRDAIIARLKADNKIITMVLPQS